VKIWKRIVELHRRRLAGIPAGRVPLRPHRRPRYGLGAISERSLVAVKGLTVAVPVIAGKNLRVWMDW
jgi:hypothetical protein